VFEERLRKYPNKLSSEKRQDLFTFFYEEKKNFAESNKRNNVRYFVKIVFFSL